MTVGLKCSFIGHPGGGTSGKELCKSGKEYALVGILSPFLFNLYAEFIM